MFKSPKEDRNMTAARLKPFYRMCATELLELGIGFVVLVDGVSVGDQP